MGNEMILGTTDKGVFAMRIFKLSAAWIFFLFFGVGCSHSIRIKGARFVAPKTAEKQWGGFASVSAGADTRVTLVKDIDNNPPTRDPVAINEGADAADLFGFNYLGFEAGLSVYDALEVYLDNSLIGLRWQFLNYGDAGAKWVAALQAGLASGSQGTSYEDTTSTSKATSEIARTQGGVSMGYKANNYLLPYLSYLTESYDVKTNVTNSAGSFGPYKDKGHHQFFGVGVMSPKAGFLWAVEYNHILIDWNRATTNKSQDVIAIRLGGAW